MRPINHIYSLIEAIISTIFIIIFGVLEISLVNIIFILAIIAVMAYGHFVLHLDRKISDRVLFNINLSRLKKKADKFISEIKNTRDGLDYSYLTGEAKSTFSKLYEGISKGDIRICTNYLEKGIYDNYKEKVDFHTLNNETCIYENLRLSEMKPVGVIHHNMCINDFVWFHVVYDGISYMRDDISGEAVEGTRKKVMNKEFWKFESVANREWRLCAIIKEEDADLRNDFKLVNEF
ncbi:MAG: TIM44-like domain-containing protein [Clostridium sp.]|nr:TIM44-like domain-containing protein [Clostridium sp.]